MNRVKGLKVKNGSVDSIKTVFIDQEDSALNIECASVIESPDLILINTEIVQLVDVGTETSYKYSQVFRWDTIFDITFLIEEFINDSILMLLETFNQIESIKRNHEK